VHFGVFGLEVPKYGLIGVKFVWMHGTRISYCHAIFDPNQCTGSPVGQKMNIILIPAVFCEQLFTDVPSTCFSNK